MIPLENKAFAKTLRQMYKINLFALSDSYGTDYGTTHETLTDVKKRSKTNFLQNFVSFGGHGSSPQEVKQEAKI